MVAKTTGAEFARFSRDQTFWPASGDTYVDDELIRVNDKEWDGDWEEIPANAPVRVEAGYVVNPAVGPDAQTLEAYFKRWLKSQNTATLVVEIDASKRDDLVSAIKAAGGKVV